MANLSWDAGSGTLSVEFTDAAEVVVLDDVLSSLGIGALSDIARIDCSGDEYGVLQANSAGFKGGIFPGDAGAGFVDENGIAYAVGVASYYTQTLRLSTRPAYWTWEGSSEVRNAAYQYNNRAPDQIRVFTDNRFVYVGNATFLYGGRLYTYTGAVSEFRLVEDGDVHMKLNGGTFTNIYLGSGNAGNNANIVLSVNSAEMIGDGITAGSVFGGGYSQNAVTKMGDSSITLTNANITNYVAGGYAAGAAAYTGVVSMTLSDTQVKTVYGGAVVSGTNHAYSGGSDITINDGTYVIGAVYGGGAVANGTEDMGSANITVNGGTITSYRGVIYGGAAVAGGTSTIDSVSITLNSGTALAPNRTTAYGGAQLSGAGTSTISSAEVNILQGQNLTFIYGGGQNATGATGTNYVGHAAINMVNGNVAGALFGGGGGIASNYATVGSVDVNIGGGTIAGIYLGGSYCNVAGDATITFSSVNPLNMNNKCIYAAPQSGGTIGGVKTMKFKDFSGAFAGYTDGNFDRFVFTGDTAVTFGRDIVSGSGEWIFDLNGKTPTATAFMLSNGAFTVPSTITVNGNAGNYGMYGLLNTTGKISNITSVVVNGEVVDISGGSGTITSCGKKYVFAGNANKLYVTLSAVSGLEQVAYSGDMAYVSATSLLGSGGVSELAENTITGNVFASNNVTEDVALTVKSGEYTQIFAGSKVTSDSNNSLNVSAEISGGTMKRNIAGLAVNGGEVNSASSSLVISGNLDAASGVTEVWNYATGVVSGSTSSLALESTSVTVDNPGNANFFAGNVVGGGRADNGGSIRSQSVDIAVQSGTVDAVFGASSVNGGSGVVDSLSIEIGAQASVTSVFGGGVVSAAGGSVSVGDAEVTVNALVGNSIFGGSFVSAGAATTDSVVINAYAGASGAIYGGGYVAGGSDTVDAAVINVEGNIDCCILGGGYAVGSGAVSSVSVVDINLKPAANLSGYIYAGGYADGGTVNVGVANINFETSSTFDGSIMGRGFVRNDGSAEVGTVSVNFDYYYGDFYGKLWEVNNLNFSAAGNVNFKKTIELSDSLMIDVSNAGSASTSHDIFSLAQDFDIAQVTADGSALEEVTDWGSLNYAYGFNDETNTVAVILAADKDAEVWSNYTIYTKLA